MDVKIEIKQEDPLSDDVDSQNEAEFFFKDVKMISSDAVLLSNDNDMAIKTEVKSETVLPDICLQNQNKFLSEDAVMKVKKYSNNHEMYNNMEIKYEPCWLKTETSSICDDIKDGDLFPVKSPRLHKQEVSTGSSDKSPLHSAENSRKHIALYNGKDHAECESQESNIMDIPTVEEHILSEQNAYSSDGHKLNSNALNLKQNNVTHKDNRSHKCEICNKEFNRLSSLKHHRAVHVVEKRHHCELCGKSFKKLSILKQHKFIHDGKKPYNCELCEKSFALLSYLKTHSLIHEGKKLLNCETCGKAFTEFPDLKKHNMIHAEIKPHKCKLCQKSFTQLPCLKRHNRTHNIRKSLKCTICNKEFSHLSGLITHEQGH